MATFNGEQCQYIIAEYQQYATTLNNFAQANADNQAVDQNSIADAVENANDASNDIASNAITANFNDTLQAYQSVSTAVETANELAAALKAEVDSINRIAKVSAGMLALALALAAPNPGGVFTAINSITTAAAGH